VSGSVIGADAECVSAGAWSVNVDAGVRPTHAPAPAQRPVPTAVVQSTEPLLQRQPRATSQVHRTTADMHHRRMTTDPTSRLADQYAYSTVYSI